MGGVDVDVVYALYYLHFMFETFPWNYVLFWVMSSWKIGTGFRYDFM